MPSRDANGKRLHGAAQRARRTPSKLEQESPNVFADFEAPPITEEHGTAELVTWGNKVMAKCIHVAMQRPDLFPLERDRLKYISETAVKLGITRDKGAEQERIKKINKALKPSMEGPALSKNSGPPPPPVPPPRRRS